MKKNELLILLIFFAFAGPGPSLFFINKYTVSFLPILSIVSIAYLLRKQIAAADFNLIIKNCSYKLVWQGLQYCIFAHALCTLIFKPSGILTDDLMARYSIMAVNVVLIGPVVEEVVYRKIIFGSLHAKWPFAAAAAVSSLIFAAAHLSPERALAYFLVGLILCYVYKKSASIFPVIVIHALLNFIPIIYNTLLEKP
ncbi:CPBP family intramembrane glutamic endopeptidase [Paenibacillus piri]|uniref:CPBP family intramembrane metalloprotease n=1 Tax=Paenibacillus piri TaxID=2547395 RepID=A0A4R5KMM9_9BACL|nr:CPBP family intramembrane glutamic endopeptidase [Paenibacillus piri]TDF95800.1 CPBP family intramembrane metalloprotease [Paenibacillus piri]